MPKGQDRAFELDFLRGITLCWVVIMHFTYAMRYIFSLNVFDYLDGQIYWTFWEPLVLSIFVGISGVCCRRMCQGFSPGKTAKRLGYNYIGEA